MKSIIKVLLSLFLVIGTVAAYATDTASILPLAKTTFLDQNGKPLTSGKVFFYVPNTTTLKATWQDASESTLNTNPVILDAAGRALIYGFGTYRQVVKDRNDNIIWDQVTSSAGSGSGSNTATGDGDLVGTVKPWAGMIAPNQYFFTYGQELARTAYPALFNAITSTQAVFCSSGSPILTGFSDTSNFPNGAAVEVSCLASGRSTIITKNASTITLAANANVTTNTTAVIFPWGDGNHTSTFNLPDLRGVSIVGNNVMGGTVSSRTNATNYGANPNSVGALGGNSSTILGASNLPPYTPLGTVTNGAITSIFAGDSGQTGLSGAGGSQAYAAGAFASTQIIGTVASTQATSTFTGTAQGGTSVPFSNTPPSMTANFIIKVTPDTNSSIASGVTSLGLMTGDIACGTGITCISNIISSAFIVGTTTIGGGTDKYDLYDNAGVLGNAVPSVFYVPKYASAQAAVDAAIAAGGGIVRFACRDETMPAGAVGLNADNSTNIILEGPFSLNGGGASCGALRYAGTGTAISAKGTVGFQMRGIELVAANAAICVDGGKGSGLTSNLNIQGNSLFCNATSGIGVSLWYTISSKVEFNIISAFVGVKGINGNVGDVSNQIQILNNPFPSGTSYPLQNASYWLVQGNTFEGAAVGKAYSQSVGVGGCFGINFISNIFSDPVNNSAWIETSCINVGSFGNVFGMIAGQVGIKLTNGSASYVSSTSDQGEGGTSIIDIGTGNNGKVVTPQLIGTTNNIIGTPTANTTMDYTWGDIVIKGRTIYSGSTSGNVAINSQAVAGTPTILWPTGSGTVAVSGTTPIVLNTTTGALTCPTCVTTSGGTITGTAPIAVSAGGVVSINAPYVSLTASNGGIVYSGATNLAILSGTATASLPMLSGSTAAPTWATIAYPTSATSGGIPYFSSTTAISSSALLTANQIVLGGGAGTAPATLGSLGTTTTVLHGNAAGVPSFAAVANADLSTMATNTVKGNATSGSATPTDLPVGTCSTAASAVIWTTNTGFGCNTSITANTATTATNATNTAITDDTTTNATVYPTWATTTTGNLPQKVSSTKMSFNPSTGVFTSTSFSGAGTGLTGTGASFTAGNVTTNANLTNDVTSVGNVTTLTNAPVIAKVLTGYSASVGTVASTDSILQAMQKLGGLVDNAAWNTYTPTITAGTGSPTVASVPFGRYKQIGKTVICQITVSNSSNVSGASGTLKATLPITGATNGYSGSSYESALTGISGGAYITAAGTFVQAAKYDGTTWWVNNYVVNINITYELP